MKNKTLSFLCAAAIPVLLSCSSRAALDPATIPADARWAIYADLNALRSSTVGKELISVAEKAQFDLGKQTMLGLDIQKTLATIGSVTAYGTNFAHEPQAVDGALILRGTPDLRKITEAVLVQQNVTDPDTVSEVKDLPFPAYSIRPKNHKGEHPMELIVAYPPEGVVLVSKSRPQLLKAHELIRGSGASVANTAGAPLKQLIDTANSTYLFATSLVPSDTEFPGDQPQARILRMTTSGALSLGEDGSKTFAHAQLIGASDDMADKIMKILQGMTALLSLTETNDKALADFLNSAQVTRNDRVVTLDLRYASDRLAQMVRTLVQEHSGEHGMAGGRPGPEADKDIVGQWNAQAVPADQAQIPTNAVHSIDSVALKNGSVITLTRRSNGGRGARFERIEITPVGGGAPLTFKTELMRIVNMGDRGASAVFEFPGIDGTYNLKVGYSNDPTGKATYAVSVRNQKGR